MQQQQQQRQRTPSPAVSGGGQAAVTVQVASGFSAAVDLVIPRERWNDPFEGVVRDALHQAAGSSDGWQCLDSLVNDPNPGAGALRVAVNDRVHQGGTTVAQLFGLGAGAAERQEAGLQRSVARVMREWSGGAARG
jgi:hypothetical protein